jgi:hypothetical protein
MLRSILIAGGVGACLAFTAPATPVAGFGLRRAGAVALCSASSDASAPSRRGFLTLAAGIAAARAGMRAEAASAGRAGDHEVVEIANR